MATIGLIGGSGLGDALGAEQGTRITIDTPFGAPSSDLIKTSWSGHDIVILQRHGDGHTTPPSMVNYRANIWALKAAGCTHVIASGAVGSLREDMAPKHLVIPDQIIDKTTRRVGTFFDTIAVHIEFATPFCTILRDHLISCQDAVETTLHEAGTYVCMEGPAFSTRAESEMHRTWGGDLIGMTVMPEAKLAREAEMAYAMVALPSDYDCWRPAPATLDKHELLREIIGNLQAATQNAVALIKAAIERFDAIAEIESPAHSAMEMGIWTRPDSIDPAEKQRLDLLVGKYLK
ncbi:MAG: S-methyl-5'-thioadenosine phosphorylase [Phycisphaerales bacterium]|jgi:5'-methylthioadenosine phosphorylase|nr:S-methyl-5'-thioadenosine phosphorylase [Phycisphaerales bacterium]MBT7171006.1 S-methyl-5'-thioadenosine phosphorylase [Phycisphaerales bacterium]